MVASNFTYDRSGFRESLQSLMAGPVNSLQSLMASLLLVNPVRLDLIQSPFFLLRFGFFHLFAKVFLFRHLHRLFLPSPLFLSFKCRCLMLMVNLSRSMQTLFLAAFDSYEY